MSEFQARGTHVLPCPGPEEQTWFTKGNEAKSQRCIRAVELSALPGGPWLSRLEPYFSLFQHRGVAVWWYREGSCRFLLVSMSLPVLSAALAWPPGLLRAQSWLAHALDRWLRDVVELGSGLGALGLGVLIRPLPLTCCATLGKSLNLSGPHSLICTSEDNDH